MGEANRIHPLQLTQGHAQCVARGDLAGEPDCPLLNLTSGYVQRGAGLFPKQGPKAPWVMRQNYILDLLNLRFGKLDDGFLSFSGVARRHPEDLHNAAIAPRTEPH